jgi:hypothetical protein
MRSGLYQALEALSEAHGQAELIRAMGAVRRAARKVRVSEDREIGKLSAAVMQAIEIRDHLKADGVTGDALNIGLEGVLRDTWPKGRSEPWHTCKGCSDYGLEMFTCPGDATCGRERPHLAHDFGKPCWCQKGARFREAPKPTSDDFTNAGKAPKRSGFARAGR